MKLWIFLLMIVFFASCNSNTSSDAQDNNTNSNIKELNHKKTNTIPVIKLNGDPYIILSEGSTYNELGAIAKDSEDGDIANKIVKSGNVNTKKAGTYKISYTVTDSDGNIASVIREVIVKEKIGEIPTITLIGNSTVTIQEGELYQDESAVAIDKEDGNITDKIKLKIKQYTDNNNKYLLTYSITDSDGNSAFVNRILIVNKNTQKTDTEITDEIPVIKLNGNSLISLNTGDIYNEEGATAIDKEDGNVTDKITISGEVNTQKAGTYKIIYKVVDSKGNSATLERTVVVKNTEISPFDKIHDILLKSKNSDTENAIYICIGDSTRVRSERDNAQLIFDTVEAELKKYNVTSFLIAKGGHELAQFINPSLNQAPTYLDVVEKIPGNGTNTIVDISLGINDLWRYKNPTKEDIPLIQADIKRDLQTAVSLILKAKPQTTILFTSPNPLKDWDPQGTEMYMKAYRTLSEELNIPFVNFYDNVFKKLTNDEKISLYRPLKDSTTQERDGVHYSDEGLEKMADYILEKIIP